MRLTGFWGLLALRVPEILRCLWSPQWLVFLAAFFGARGCTRGDIPTVTSTLPNTDAMGHLSLMASECRLFPMTADVYRSPQHITPAPTHPYIQMRLKKHL
jgi:hypothetical protein